MTGKFSEFQRRLLRWYDDHRRDLPWRLAVDASADVVLDPYHVLVSEAMLQQTQVATVIPYFHSFLKKFPTVHVLAKADLQEVLRAWQGLGYYSRARNLQKAATKIVTDFNGQVPETVDQLLELPGVGRYTAGAVSSLAFGHRAAILDGNVARVLCRLDAIREDPRDPVARELLWTRADQILPRKRIGDFNSALMELGALVCAPAIAAMSFVPGEYALRRLLRRFGRADSPAEESETDTVDRAVDILHPQRRSLSRRAAPGDRSLGRDVAVRDHRADRKKAICRSDQIAIHVVHFVAETNRNRGTRADAPSISIRGIRLRSRGQR